MNRLVLAVLTTVTFLSGSALADERTPLDAGAIAKAAAAIDDARLAARDGDRGNWLTYNGQWTEQRFSPLDQVSADNVSDLRLVWSFSTESSRGLEATPVVVDGVMYTTAPWSVVFAVDARTGKEIWRYDPKVDKQWGQKACCDVVNRGVAVYKGKVFVGALDARLIALDASTGKVVWEVKTAEAGKPYTITGAPRIAAGKVLIGNGGGEYGVRGYVSAYDSENGTLLWRTYTVPGDRAKPQETKALEHALTSWKGDQWLKIGGGGTAWDAIVYDAELETIYFGTGNGVAWNRDIRSPGGGDNLYLSSIVALDAATGEQKWYYQTTPGDNWDFDSASHLILADLKIGGKERKVLMQAPKNGFFYVLDRKTGELLSAAQFADTVTWAKKVDLKTGRPVEVEGQRYDKGMAIVAPSAFGAHNWQPMSFSPKTGLVYIPAQEVPGAYERDPNFKIEEGFFNTGLRMERFKDLNRTIVRGHLLAWDPVKGKEAWRVPYQLAWNGGTLASAGNLVFQGTSDGRFVAYSADHGKKLWETVTGTGIIAGPMSYEVDGVQYVSVSAGWGGTFALAGGDASRAGGTEPNGKVLTFALASKVGPPLPQDPELAEGERLYHHYCVVCHGARAISGTSVPDLRHSTEDVQKIFGQTVKDGRPGTGMAGFGKWIGDAEIGKIQNYLRARAKEDVVLIR